MPFDFNLFANALHNRLLNRCYGFSFVVSYKNDWKEKKDWGCARNKHNPPVLDMSAAVPFHTASVSKTITAAALLKALIARADVSIDSPIHPHLPEHWGIHAHKKKTTFRQLLTHTSGYGSCRHDYQSLKNFMAKAIPGVNDYSSSKHAYNYVGTNYGLMRFLIPALIKVPVFQMKKAGASQEIIQASLYAGAYINYVQQALFEKAGLSGISCNALPFISGVGYHFPDNCKPGTDFGDQTLSCGAKGWVMSAQQMAKFFRALHFTENILPAAWSKKMTTELLGYGSNGATKKGTGYYEKRGHFPRSSNPGEVRTMIIGYDNDVQVALIINSNMSKGKGVVELVNEAHDMAGK